MEFKDKLIEYLELLDCTAKDLSDTSGLSTATISRYKSGDRIPEANSENFTNLVKGIVEISKNKNIKSLTIESVTSEFLPLVKNTVIDTKNLQSNFSILLNTLSVNISELSKFMNFDPSYISRIKNGKRQPSNPQEFINNVVGFIVRRYNSNSDKIKVSKLINCDSSKLNNPDNYTLLLAKWLSDNDSVKVKKDDISGFLEKIDEFNLDEYIRAINFDKLKVPTVPFQLPTSKSYYGLKEMMESELEFLKATVLSKSKEPVTMYSDMPMNEMAKDPEFPKKWMFGMALMLKKGLHFNQIHNIDRSFEDMMLGLESWIPMYMTGQISSYYLKGQTEGAFSHLIKVSGTVALVGEAITGYHNKGKYYLTKNKSEVAYYKEYAKCLLSKATPLMKVYSKDSHKEYEKFLYSDSKVKGNRHCILSSLSLHTISDKLLSSILNNNNVDKEKQNKIMDYISLQKEMINAILQHSCITEEIPILSKEEFEKFPIVLPLSGMFLEKDIYYTWEDYKEHLQLIKEFEKDNANYKAIENHKFPFRNIQIYIHQGKYVMLSKNKTPSIHFLIRHQKMRNAFENMIIPIIEE